MRPSSAEQRSAVRAFVRRNHPDVGGDPEHFAAGLAELRARPGVGAPEVGAAEPAGSDPAGFDAPVIGVQRPRGIRGAAQRWRARRVRRKRRRVR